MPAPTRRDFMKLTAASAAAASLTEALSSTSSAETPHADGSIVVRVTGGARRYAEAQPLAWHAAPPTYASESALVIDPARRMQPVLGFGAAFTDASCWVFSQMPQPAREALLRELFDPARLNLSVCRTCIGSSDYSRSVFSYDEGEPDPQLTRFSIDHDKAYILPTLRQARAINPGLFLLSSPWSPPGWMKDNNSMLGGTLRRRYMEVYANYIVKFLQAYRSEGVIINAVTPQNEVDTDQDSRMPACLFPQEVEVGYVAQNLGPAIEKAGLETKIWLLDHNYNLWGRAICELDDPGVRKYTNAIAWHGYVGKPEWMRRVLAAHYGVEMYWTEGGPDINDPNYALDWTNWSRIITGVLRNGPRCIIGWNLALDEHGKPNIGPFSCGGLVTVHSQTHAVTRSGQYWALSHFSRDIRRGATVVESQGDLPGLHHVAAQNPDGSWVLVLTNETQSPRTLPIHMGARSTVATLPPNSVTTLTWKD